jgi:hypothetical protein|tara:strand:+ start:256 stop:471 length:216 start_codon:yes stop_codon:yes gene_type:complete
MNIFKTIGKLGYRTQKASTTIIKHPKQAWSDIKQGYEEGKQFDAYVNGRADTLEVQRPQPSPQPQQMELDI